MLRPAALSLGPLRASRPAAVWLTASAALGGVLGGIVVAVVVVSVMNRPQPTLSSSGTVNVDTPSDFNVDANHVRLVGHDGNFELEHGASAPSSRISAYVLGTPERTPVTIGGEDQDVTSLVVDGREGQSSDLQQWTPSGSVALAVDSQGRLRFKGVTIWAAEVDDRIVLYAQGADGRVRRLATG